ncbi:response regulator [Cereibacter changlensis]|uniref:response regulator n=1 Tax=Cereibacter changlensis TaxID=402884 RepID=UPI0040346EDE
MKVLILEDEVLLACMLAEEVREAGHVVLGPVYCIADALSLAEASPPDLALLNLELPDGESGAEAAAVMRSRWNTQAVFVSGGSHVASEHRVGAIGFLDMPHGTGIMRDALRVVEQIIAGEPIERVPEALTLYV